MGAVWSWLVAIVVVFPCFVAYAKICVLVIPAVYQPHQFYTMLEFLKVIYYICFGATAVMCNKSPLWLQENDLTKHLEKDNLFSSCQKNCCYTNALSTSRLVSSVLSVVLPPAHTSILDI
ncbi:hypothetical protein GOODEAATRI_006442 [Goodea atripinnis]|uniref:Uncharacterized protein n=1 Tax=Goodea atripinnis TaxID=208336 RepID=A0ABV0P241_9TELE